MSRGSTIVVAYAPQTTNEVPKTGWKILPYVSNGLSASFENTESQTITDSRLTQAGLVTGGQVQGDIEVEFAKDAYDDWLAAAAFSEWKSNVLTFAGNSAKTFAVEVGYKDVGIYHYYGGVRVNTLKLALSDTGYATCTFGVMGTDYKNQNDTPYSKSPTKSANLQRVTSLSVEDIKIDGVTTKGVACVTEFSFEIDNNIQAQKCLGDGIFAGALLEMMAKMSGAMTLAYGKKSPRDYQQANDRSDGCH